MSEFVCVACGASERKHYAKGMCKPCYMRAYRLTDNGKAVKRKAQRKYLQTAKGRETQRKYRLSDKYKVAHRKARRKYRRTPAGKEVQRKAERKYRQTPVGKDVARRHVSERVRRGGSASKSHRSDENILRLYARDGGLCAWCGEPLPLPPDLFDGSLVHVDHIKAIAAGGKHEPDNWQLLHAICNNSKQDRAMIGAPIHNGRHPSEGKETSG